MFFVGVDDSGNPERYSQITKSKQGLAELKDGQFFYSHQCAEGRSFIRLLRGVFLPIYTCKDLATKAELSRTAATNRGHGGDFPIRELKSRPKTDDFLGSPMEEFIPFGDPASTVRWLNDKGMEYLVRIETPDVFADAAKTEGDFDFTKKYFTSPLQWNTLERLADWLHAGGVLSDRDEITAAFLYTSSD